MSAAAATITKWTEVQFVSHRGQTVTGMVYRVDGAEYVVEITGLVVRPGVVETDPDFVRDIGVSEVRSAAELTVL